MKLHAFHFGAGEEDVGGQDGEQVVVEGQPQEMGQPFEGLFVHVAQIVGQQKQFLHLRQSREHRRRQVLEQIAANVQLHHFT